jgi:hypothetical protein
MPVGDRLAFLDKGRPYPWSGRPVVPRLLLEHDLFRESLPPLWQSKLFPHHALKALSGEGNVRRWINRQSMPERDE